MVMTTPYSSLSIPTEPYICVNFLLPDYVTYYVAIDIAGFSPSYMALPSLLLHPNYQSLKNFLSDVAISLTLNQAASCGDNCIKIHDLQDLKEVYTIISVEEEKGASILATYTLLQLHLIIVCPSTKMCRNCFPV